jgi:hypothetical protein
MSKRTFDDFENPPPRPAEERVEDFWQEVRALNAQFAQWVSRNTLDNSDKLWESGLREYIKFGAKIRNNYKDVLTATGTLDPDLPAGRIFMMGQGDMNQLGLGVGLGSPTFASANASENVGAKRSKHSTGESTAPAKVSDNVQSPIKFGFPAPDISGTGAAQNSSTSPAKAGDAGKSPITFGFAGILGFPAGVSSFFNATTTAFGDPSIALVFGTPPKTSAGTGSVTAAALSATPSCMHV